MHSQVKIVKSKKWRGTLIQIQDFRPEANQGHCKYDKALSFCNEEHLVLFFTGTIKQTNRKNYMVLRVDQDLVETSQSTKELTKVIHEQWLPEKHDLNQGKFQRGQSKSEVPSGQDTWLTFGGAPTDDSSGVIDAFASKQFRFLFCIYVYVLSCKLSARFFLIIFQKSIHYTCYIPFDLELIWILIQYSFH